MSMYGELLELALGELEEAHGKPGADLEKALADELERRRRALSRCGAGHDASERIASEVSYDAALVSLCRARGIDWAPSWFDRPALARAHLEAALGSHVTGPVPERCAPAATAG